MVTGKIILEKISFGFIYKVLYGRIETDSGVIRNYEYDSETQIFSAGELLFNKINKIVYI